MARILVVEDTWMNLELFKDILSLDGHEVLTAETAEDGISQAIACQPDLILMDLGLPGVDGEEAIRRLKSQPETAALRIAALTAHASDDDRARVMSSGHVLAYITKPIEVSGFRASIRRLLPS